MNLWTGRARGLRGAGAAPRTWCGPSESRRARRAVAPPAAPMGRRRAVGTSRRPPHALRLSPGGPCACVPVVTVRAPDPRRSPRLPPRQLRDLRG
ncbi:hypothetical protein QJS66_17745 [Kocuria rhizophila]|nr:hypothetical protein QJS66_17745 [Kocuria rhizophila]